MLKKGLVLGVAMILSSAVMSAENFMYSTVKDSVAYATINQDPATYKFVAKKTSINICYRCMGNMLKTVSLDGDTGETINNIKFPKNEVFCIISCYYKYDYVLNFDGTIEHNIDNEHIEIFK